MTHRDTFSGFPVRARVCARTGKTCHEASCVIRGSRREARKGDSRRSPWRDAPEDMDDLLVSAPCRNELPVAIHSVSLLSTGLRTKSRVVGAVHR